MYPCQRSLVCSPAKTIRPARRASRDDLLMLGLDEFAAKLSVLAGREGAHGPDTSAGVLTGVDDRDDRASSCEYASRRQPR
jgi:hypothetical protein